MTRPWSAIGNMLMLYVGKTAGLLVAFIFLPLYSRLLGPDQFGVVAVILSFQALLVMMDLGMSTLVSREIAVASVTGGALLKLIRTAELSLSCFYTLLLLGALFIRFLGGLSGLTWFTVVITIILFWILVLQNLYYLALLAHRDYTLGSLIQVVGVVLRAGVTTYVLAYVSTSLEAFVSAQLVVAAVHWWITRIFCTKRILGKIDLEIKKELPALVDAAKLTRAGGALVLFSAAGAAVMQLDKPLISLFVSSASVAPYYMASLLCMTPISILAGPVSQYFQPLILRTGGNAGDKNASRVVVRFVISVFAVTSLPTLILWWFREPIVDVWIGQHMDNELISRYVEILLPGLAIGALGFVPYSLLILAKDFRFQAMLSTGMTLVTLTLAAISASLKNVEAVCVVYSVYHASSTVVSWIRVMMLPMTKHYARQSAVWAVILISALASILVLSSYILG